MKKEIKINYETLSVFIEDKVKFIKMAMKWNIENPRQKKTKAEFFRMLINKYKENERQEKKE